MATSEVAQKFRAIVAAARRVRLDSTAAVKETVASRENWQEDIWPYYDEVPEAKYALNFIANSLSKVRFYAAALDENGMAVPINSESSLLRSTAIAQQADFEMERVKSPVAGQSEINRLLTLNVEITGEAHLHGMSERDAIGEPDEIDYRPERLIEAWEVRSKAEIEVTDEKVIVIDVAGNEVTRPKIVIKRSPNDKGEVFDPDTETLIRYWQRHPKWSDLADSLFRGCMSDCEMITLYSNEAKAVSKSRHSAGAFTLPSELSFVDDTKSGEDQEQGGEQNAFVKAFAETMLDPISNPASPSAVQPMLISGPAEFLKPDVLRKIDLSRPADDKIHEKIDKHINRLARGLNVPVEVVMGHMSTTFANAEQIDQDVFDDHLESRCISLAEFYLVGFLRPQLLDAGFAAELIAEVQVAYDASSLVRQATPAEHANDLLDHSAISIAAYRRLKGVSEDDAPDDSEYWRNVAIRKGIFTADLTTALLRKGGVDLGISVEGGDINLPAEDVLPETKVEPEEPDAEAEALAAAARATNPGKRLADIDRTLRAKIVAAADAALSRALERAGNKLKNKGSVLRASLRSVAPYRCAAQLGPTLIADAGMTPDDLLSGAWDDLGVQFKTWATDSGDAALDIVSEITGGMSVEERAALKLRQLSNVDEAWEWLSGSLSTEGKAALFDPDATKIIEALGEIDFPGRVPPSMIREALARAGGASGYLSNNGVLTPTNKAPLGGIATGELVMGKLADEGIGVEGYTWVYGPARRRTFPPHLALSGKFFVNFDSPILANSTGWPHTSHFYPGDHKGCVCDFEPSIQAPVKAKPKPKPKAAIVPVAEPPVNAPAIGRADPKQPAPKVRFLTGAPLENELRQMPRVRDRDQADAVQWYTRDGSARMNDALRRSAKDPLSTIRDKETLKSIEHMDKALHPLPVGAVTYRGINARVLPKNLGGFKKGDEIVDAGFLSTSTSKSVAGGFKGSNGVILRVEAPPGTRAIWVENAGASNRTERELVLHRDAVLEVTKVETKVSRDRYGDDVTETIVHARVRPE